MFFPNLLVSLSLSLQKIEESARFRLPHIAAEILSCEVPQINEQVSSDENMLKKLYSFLEQEPPLNPLLSSFFSKAFGVLITRKSEQVSISLSYYLLLLHYKT